MPKKKGQGGSAFKAAQQAEAAAAAHRDSKCAPKQAARGKARQSIESFGRRPDRARADPPDRPREGVAKAALKATPAIHPSLHYSRTKFSPEHKVTESKAAARRAFGRRYLDNPAKREPKNRPPQGVARTPCWHGYLASSSGIPIGTRGHLRSCRAASPRSRPKSSRQTPTSCRKRPRQWSDGRGLCHDLDSAPALRMSAPYQSLPRSCARAARGRDRQAGMLRPHAGATVLACSRRAGSSPHSSPDALE
jgi:hypothetical protein